MADRFYVPPESISQDSVRFADDQSRQIRNVLRLRAGDEVLVFDGSGREYQVSLRELQGAVTGRVVGGSTPSVEPLLNLTLVQSLVKGEKVELVLQKCTEIGVCRFVIVESSRSVAKIPDERLASRLDRWRSIVKEAAEQSGRVKVPQVEGVLSFSDSLGLISDEARGVIAWEEEKSSLLGPVLEPMRGAREIILFVGPEGGFTADEVGSAVKAGAVPVSLGPRILRAETAAIVASALTISAFESAQEAG